MTSPNEQRQRTTEASLGRPFTFEQGASLHVGVLGMVGRPSGPYDEAPFFLGTSHDGRSHGRLDLRHMQPAADGDTDGDGDEPDLHVWFDPTHTILDISEAFAAAPAEALQGSGIPAEVVAGPVQAERSGDSGDGLIALLTQMCGAKILADPATLVHLIASEHVLAFEEHQVDQDKVDQQRPEDEQPLRAFNASIPLHKFLAELGLSSTTLINQIAVLGFDLRLETSPELFATFEQHLRLNAVRLAWFVDEQDRIRTVQAVVNLTDFLVGLLSSDEMVARLASEEQMTVDEIREFIDEAAEGGRIAYFNAIWQTVEFNDEVEPINWPDAANMTSEMAAQAQRLRQPAEDNTH